MKKSDVDNEIERMMNNRKVTGMNDRYRELAKEAGLLVHNPEKMPTKLGKFAELMINDCIKELEISRRCDPYTGKLYDCEYNTCIGEQIEVLKARFGVN